MKVHEYFRMLIIVGRACLAGGSLVLAEESTNRGGPDSIDWAKPLAQDFVVVYQVRDLKDEEKSVCVGTPDIIRLPSGRLIASMDLWLKMPDNTYPSVLRAILLSQLIFGNGDISSECVQVNLLIGKSGL